jgi:hypothetical protein
MATLFKRYSEEMRNAQRDRIRSRGKWRYILIRGIFGFGFLAGSIALSVELFVEHHRLGVATVLIELLVWGLSGLFYGWWMWRLEYEDEENER